MISIRQFNFLSVPLRAIFITLGLLGALPAGAHDGRPLFINITEYGEGAVTLRWKTPPAVGLDNVPRIALTDCAGARPQPRQQRPAGAQRYVCADGVSGKSLVIDYPLFKPPVAALLRIGFQSGETRSALLDPGVAEWRIPAPATFAGVAGDYFALGVEHIFGGLDHLLFLAGLLYIAGSLRRILITVTGFTLAHSVTLFLVARDVIRVSVPAVEAVIALSIVMLATEIARNDRATLTWRRPVLVACGFGLVHGAGFAAALTETGLPQTETLSALLFFNLGVEAGQLLIIAALFAGLWLIARLRHPPLPAVGHQALRLATGYAMGIVAAFWFIERLAPGFV